MICGLEIGFEPTTNFTLTYKVSLLEWVENQPLGLKLVYKLKGSPSGITHSRLRDD